jgi:regulator of RNase E activity RraA
MATDSLAARLARLDTATVSDVLDEAGFPSHALSHRITSILPGVRFAGPAVCLRGQGRVVTRATPPDANLSSYTLDRAAQVGAVLVVATDGFVGGAIVGGAIARGLRRMSCAGLVTDGLVRDRAELLDIGLPIVAAGLTPVNGSRRWALVDTQGPAILPGQGNGSVVIHTGDYILGDGDGVVVIPHRLVAEVVVMAEELARKDGLIAEDMLRGVQREEAFKRHDCYAHIHWLREKNGGVPSP